MKLKNSLKSIFSINSAFFKYFPPLLVILLVSILQIYEPQFLKELEYRTWDLRAKIVSESSYMDPNIKIIEIDQASLNFFNDNYSLTWPFPREIYKNLVNYFKQAGAKGIAFDLIFSESSAQSPMGDQKFAESITEAKLMPVVIGMVLDNDDNKIPDKTYSLFSNKQTQWNNSHSIKNKYDFNNKNFPVYNSADFPIEELLKEESITGYVHADPDSDGIFRKHTPVSFLNDIPVLSLSFALYESSNNNKLNLNNLFVNDKDLIVKLSKIDSEKQRFSFASIIQSSVQIENNIKPQVNPEVFKDSYVFIATTAPGLLDFRPNSIDERGYGVEFQASVLDNILSKNFINKPSVHYQIVISIILVLAGWFTKYLFKSFKYQIFVWLFILITYTLILYYSAFAQVWLNFIIPVFAFLLVLFLSISIQYLKEGRQHRFIKKAFGQYVSPAVISQIVKNPSQLSLGGEKKELTILFSDIAGFTSASEKIEPSLLVNLLNEYLTLLSDIVQKYDGTIDKYIGDAILAFWNAPLELSNHSDLAIRAAIECQTVLNDKQDYFLQKYGYFPKTRIGIHTAQVNVGNFGSKNRFDYTVIGDGVNLASRLEGVNKIYGTEIIVSEQAIKKSSEIKFRKIGSIRVVGKNDHVTIFEPLYKYSSIQAEQLENYEQALKAFQGSDFELSQKYFHMTEQDPVSKAYLDRIQNEKNNKDFTPIWNLTKK